MGLKQMKLMESSLEGLRWCLMTQHFGWLETIYIYILRSSCFSHKDVASDTDRGKYANEGSKYAEDNLVLDLYHSNTLIITEVSIS